MKRYLLFAGYKLHSPVGGWYDFEGSFDTAEAAVEHWYKSLSYHGRGFVQVVDTTTGKPVAEPELTKLRQGWECWEQEQLRTLSATGRLSSRSLMHE